MYSIMHPSTLLLAFFATPLLALAATTESTSASTVGSQKFRRQAPHLRSQRTRRSSKKQHSRRSNTSPFIESSSHLSLTRLTTRSDKNAHLHPQVLLQQHIHRGVKRHARMTKRSLGEDADVEMAHKMVKRWEITSTPSSSEESTTKEKRWLGGVALAGATETVQRIQNRLSRILSNDRELRANTSITTLPAPGGIGMARYGVSGSVGETIAKSREANSNSTFNEPRPPKGDNTQDGYSEIDLEAASTNRITPASDPTAINSLGLAIEANDVGELDFLSLLVLDDR